MCAVIRNVTVRITKLIKTSILVRKMCHVYPQHIKAVERGEIFNILLYFTAVLPAANLDYYLNYKANFKLNRV